MTAHAVTIRCSSHWQGALITAIALAWLFFSATADAKDCSQLAQSDFKSGPELKKLQQAVFEAYSTKGTSEEPPKDLSDGLIGPATIIKFTDFCNHIGLPDSADLLPTLTQALLAFHEIVKANPDWRSDVESDEFRAWTQTLVDGTYGVYFSYKQSSPLIPGGAFLLKRYAARTLLADEIIEPMPKVTSSESKSIGRFVLEEDDLEKQELVDLIKVEPKVAMIENLIDFRFPNEDLFGTAVRLTTGLSKTDNAMNTILVVAQKPYDRGELGLTPIQWDGGDCGCGVFEGLSAEYPRNLYAIQPFWKVPQTENKAKEEVEGEEKEAVVDPPVVVDFSMLDRIGYYGVTFGDLGKRGSMLHFKQEEVEEDEFWKRRNYADFVKRAHQYKTKVDLIVYNTQWQDWLSGTEVQIESLSHDISEKLQEELEGPLNKIKQIISLGFSPRRTMADGVTFDFDFNGLKADDEQITKLNELMGKEFFKNLREKLRKPDGWWPGAVDYHINIIVPVNCLVGASNEDDPSTQTGCAYYSHDNLIAIEPFVNLFLVDLSTSDGARTVREETKRVRDRIEQRLDAGKQIRFLKKLIPLVSPQMLQELQEELQEADTGAKSLQYVDWNLTGFASWELVANEDLRTEIKEAFINQSRTQGNDSSTGNSITNKLTELEASVCAWACPNRWLLRAIIAVVALLTVAFLVVSYWFVSLRKLYAAPGFTVGVIAASTVLIVTLWCDPFWKQRQSLILFATLFASMAYWLVRKKQAEREYP